MNNSNFFVPEEWESEFKKLKKEVGISYIIAYLNEDVYCFSEHELKLAMSKNQFKKIGRKKKKGHSDGRLIKKTGKCSGRYLQTALAESVADIDFRALYFSGTIFIGVKVSRKKNPIIFGPGVNASFHKSHFIEATKKMKTKTLLAIGERIAPTDHVVAYYNHYNHNNKRMVLEKAIRRAYGIGAFDHVEQAREILESLEPELIEEVIQQQRIAEQNKGGA